jgi:nicotinamide-nucleotide amidase
MKAEIISIGTELLLGEIVNTNSSFIAAQLPPLGIDLHVISTVGDNEQNMLDIIDQAWKRSDLIITTGGLGPTQDDITREAIAKFLGEEITIDKIALQKIEDLFKERNFEMTPNNIKQASAIPSAEIIENLKGTAPGWWVEKDGHIIIAIPGPPFEMQSMWYEEIVPRLKQKTSSTIIVSRTLKTYGLGESKVDDMLGDLHKNDTIMIGTYAKHDGIHIRITAKSDNQARAEEIIREQENNIKKILDKFIWGIDSETIESVVVNLLALKGLTFASMESETGGLLADRILNAEGSSTCYKGGLVAHNSEAKIAFGIKPELITQHGAVSIEVARDMATLARKKLHTDIGISITGTLEPASQTEKPPGTTYIGIDDGTTTHTFERSYPAISIRIKERALNAVFFSLRRVLTQESGRTG